MRARTMLIRLSNCASCALWADERGTRQASERVWRFTHRGIFRRQNIEARLRRLKSIQPSILSILSARIPVSQNEFPTNRGRTQELSSLDGNQDLSLVFLPHQRQGPGQIRKRASLMMPSLICAVRDDQGLRQTPLDSRFLQSVRFHDASQPIRSYGAV
ncbi:hypothetical protein F4824DRAFT_247394 [Ustulina deusta]|nr:hypothetical protein F4824DRAFT_247394 [Ustulina deusta]